MTILRVTEVKEPLIIGKFYLVPCVTMPVDIEGFKAGKPIPVIGDLHADPSLGVSQLHYHYDRRFIKPEIHVGFVVSVRVCATGEEIHPKNIFWKRRKCYCNSLSLPDSFCPILEAEFGQCRLINRRCPHKNIPLNGLQPDSDGNVICPGHGLKWNLATGQLVSRFS